MGSLSSDGLTLAITSAHGSYLLTINGASMTGTGHARSHVPGEENEHFGSALIEMRATS